MLTRKDIVEITSLRQLPANRRHIGYSGPLDDCLKAHNAQYTWEVAPQAFYLTTIGVMYVPAEWVRPVAKVAHS